MELTDSDRQRITDKECYERLSEWYGIIKKRESSETEDDYRDEYTKLLEAERTDLLAKVSEQEKEIAAWKNVSERRAIEPQQLKKELSEQSQRIEALTKENEDLQEMCAQMEATKTNIDCPHCGGEIQVYQDDSHLSFMRLEDTIDRLREREKELVEALSDFCQSVRKSDEKYTDWVGTSEVYDALFKSESLLSKFEVPNQS